MLFPYLNGEDLNSRPDASASRWVIDFNDRTGGEAANYALPFQRVVDLVKPERMMNKRKPRRDFWWLFAERAAGMRNAISDLPQVLVVGLVSKTVMPVRVPADQVFSHKLGVFATDSYAVQAVLSSATHWLWAVKYGSTLETRVNYSSSDVFETFPFPALTDDLDAVGRALDGTRRDIMLRRGLGVTKLYNLVSDATLSSADDPDVATLRELHVEVDEVVRDAFAWSDIDLDYGFHSYRKMQRWSIGPSAQIELLDRLLEENHRRATGTNQGGTTTSKRQTVPMEAGTLFE